MPSRRSRRSGRSRRCALCPARHSLTQTVCAVCVCVPILAIWRHHHRHQLQQQLGDKLYRRHCAAVVSANQFTTNFTSGTFLSVSLSPFFTFLPFYRSSFLLLFSLFLSSVSVFVFPVFFLPSCSSSPPVHPVHSTLDTAHFTSGSFQFSLIGQQGEGTIIHISTMALLLEPATAK